MKSNNVLSGILLAFIVGSFYILVTPMNEANALLWSVLSNANTQQTQPNISVIDGNGNVDVGYNNQATILQFSGSSPYGQLHATSLSNLGCTAMNRGIFVDVINSKVWSSCGAGNFVVQLDQSSLGVLNSTTTATLCCNGMYMLGSVLVGAGTSGDFYAWFISGSNIIRCGTNAGQCGGIATYHTTTGCGTSNGAYPDFKNSVVYMDCTAPSASIYRLNINNLGAITNWNKAAACVAGCTTIQNDLAYDSLNNFIWSSEAGGTLQAYNTTGSAIRSIVLAGATSGLINPKVIGNQIYFLDLTRQFQFQYNTNGTATSSAYFGNIIVTPTTGRASYQVSSNGISIVGAQDNGGNGWVILGGTGQGNIPGSGSGGGSTNTCGSTNVPPHCVGDVNCDLQANAGLLMCQNALLPNGCNSLVLCGNNNGGGFNPINMTANQINTALGLSGSMKTNGVGYFLLAVAIIVFEVLWYASVHYLGSTRGVIVPQPMYIGVLIALVIMAGFTLAGWTDPLFLIIALVGMVAFTAPKIVNMVRGGGSTMTGET